MFPVKFYLNDLKNLVGQYRFSKFFSSSLADVQGPLTLECNYPDSSQFTALYQ